MDQVTKAKTQFRAEQWVQLIKECQSSGMRVDDWCAANSISHHAYYYWLRKLRMATIRRTDHSTALMEVPEESTTVFKKLEVQPPVPNTQAAVIIHINGATVEVNDGTSQQTIQAVLLALQSVC